MTITETSWRKLHDESTDHDTKHAISWIAEHGEWGEYDEDALKEATKKADQYVWDMTHDENGNFKLGGGTFCISGE